MNRSCQLTDSVKTVLCSLVLVFGLQSRLLSHKRREIQMVMILNRDSSCCSFSARSESVDASVRHVLLPAEQTILSCSHLSIINVMSLRATTQCNQIRSACTSHHRRVTGCLRVRERERETQRVHVSLPELAVFPPWCSRSCPLGAPGYRCEIGTCQSDTILAETLRFTSMHLHSSAATQIPAAS